MILNDQLDFSLRQIMKALTIILISILPFPTSLLKFILDEKIDKCAEETTLDSSSFEFVMINDTATIANGSIVFIRDLKAPINGGFYGEQYERGLWFKKFERKFSDFCQNILSVGEV